MPMLNVQAQMHMFNMHGVKFPFRCDSCRTGFHDVLSLQKAEAGGKTFCKDCSRHVKLTPEDTVEFTPIQSRPSFLGRRNDPDVPESQTNCTDCNAELKPSLVSLFFCYIVTVNRIRKAVCHECYTEKYKQQAPAKRTNNSSPAFAAPYGDVSKVEKVIVKAISDAPKQKWNVGVLFEELKGQSKPLIREAVRRLKKAGTLLIEDHALKLNKQKI